MKLPITALAWNAVNRVIRRLATSKAAIRMNGIESCVAIRTPSDVLALDVVFLEHRVNPLSGSGNQNDLDAGRSQHGQIFEELREVRRVQDRVIDLQYDGLAVETVLVIEDFPDQVDLFPMLDLVHEPTLAVFAYTLQPENGEGSS